MCQKLRIVFIKATLLFLLQTSYGQQFTIHDKNLTASIFYDKHDYATVKIAAELLALDIEKVTGHRPSIVNSLAELKGNVIIIGSCDSALFIKDTRLHKLLNTSRIEGKWETYLIRTLKKPLPNVATAMVICGSDRRGTAFGVFDISERIGVSPWYWWADVHPKRVNKLALPAIDFISNPPSVKYRGIFLNDEDWGLQPWAAKTFEPETGDIGSKTYAKIFELLLRLKANLIWPAMHPSTKAFYYYPKNKEVADQYGIVVGSSHAEPMLCNNVGEWDKKTMGDFNYFTNKENVFKYWNQRAADSRFYENIYTLGMRGVHDSGMEGVSTIENKLDMLGKIFTDQRQIIKTNIQADVSKVPQAFIPYKEVLDVYDAGLNVPDDATLVWPDDNYGYIHRLNGVRELNRAGGAGVYYHLSYWGRPHDYLWLSSTHPVVIWEEMFKAYQTKNDRMWIANVGDIKPIEYNMNLFLDMAYDMKSFSSSASVKEHLEKWVGDVFGTDSSTAIADITWEYYQLAFERRPDFMGWSQTEPTRVTDFTDYNHFYFNDEAQKRLDRYESLYKQISILNNHIPAKRRDAFYQLVYYPVRCAQLINRKFLQSEKSYYYAKQHRASANDLAALAKQAYDSIVMETTYFNTMLANGKWNAMMSFHPRNLPVFDPPVTASWPISDGTWGLCTEGFVDEISGKDQYGGRLPVFYVWNNKEYYIDIFLTGAESINWNAVASEPWIKLNKISGSLTNTQGSKQERIWVSIDHRLLPKERSIQGSIIIKAAGKELTVRVSAVGQTPEGFTGFIEENQYVSIFASHCTGIKNDVNFQWRTIEGASYSGKGMMLIPTKDLVSDPAPNVNASLEYEFYTFSKGATIVNVYCLPTHALNPAHKMRIAVSIDDGEPQIIDYRTFDRSETWKQNVLKNSAVNTSTHELKSAGKHKLIITALDPGVVVDRITIDLGGLRPAYSAIAETKIDLK